ncbi:MAG: hypothetical protein WB239_03580 [Acidimicrobiia bacterium]
MDFRILGSMEAIDNGKPVALGCRLGPSRVGPGFLPPTSRLRRQGPSPLLRKGDKGETPVGEG